MHILVTGGAGFIGSHLIDRLLASGDTVTCVDNFDAFYDPRAKRENCRPHLTSPQYQLLEGDLAEPMLYERLPDNVEAVIHLAAKAGVRPSIEDPLGYQRANVSATQLLLEWMRKKAIGHLVFASSSSVYGTNPDVPWREDNASLQPISPYASTKLSGEFLCRVYSHLYRIRILCLRFFTVYGPRQRPDLAIHKFARLMREGRPLPFFGDGSTRRDYTYVSDTVDGILAALRYQSSQFEIINLGNNSTVSLSELVAAMESVLQCRAGLQRLPEQPGDVPQTWACLEKARKLLGYQPGFSLTEGLREFADWFERTS